MNIPEHFHTQRHSHPKALKELPLPPKREPRNPIHGFKNLSVKTDKNVKSATYNGEFNIFGPLRDFHPFLRPITHLVVSEPFVLVLRRKNRLPSPLRAASDLKNNQNCDTYFSHFPHPVNSLLFTISSAVPRRLRRASPYPQVAEKLLNFVFAASGFLNFFSVARPRVLLHFGMKGGQSSRFRA